ncbi:TRAP transporter small permease subunit [Yoonia sediminilitoris]|uniref:TRAP transporter small permease protein n=1 Tax=Yoonia sediminilitoris TaxID=1286148 RepID=A0A2T6KMP6_9RHOB|nr:TRAP transporter small permease [Yoonia sediminilitoris]PUB17451.1 tripartite ATP-independent transporter DctQ subunit [Yoonia sediminilitoris]RCW97746.1 tripartite ATP-independent transporter DctQ subunit [Yoonia sediminilitoris]
MEFVATWISRLFGWSLLGLSAFVALETVMRKLFNTSLQGADELGGYVLAFGSSLAFVVTLAERAHIRIDVLHQKFPLFMQSLIDWLAAVSMAVLGCFFLYVGWFVLKDTLAYGSTAATPWATPLIWPQTAWYGALAVFSISAILLSFRATWLFFRRDYNTLTAEFNPKGAAEELADELQELNKRKGHDQ